MKLVNLCSHDITILIDNKPTVIDDEGHLARYQWRVTGEETLPNGIRVLEKRAFAKGLPHEREGVLYVVSSTLQGAFPERKDLLSPCMHGAMKYQNGPQSGQIAGIKFLQRFNKGGTSGQDWKI